MSEKISFAVIGLLAGIILAWLFAVSAVNGQHAGMMRLMGMRNMIGGAGMMAYDDYDNDHRDMMSSPMKEMMQGLQNKTADEFDQAFLAEMIVHHQGAINMASLALQNTKHQEIRDLATKIISAQAEEIHQMQAWQRAWYPQ